MNLKVRMSNYVYNNGREEFVKDLIHLIEIELSHGSFVGSQIEYNGRIIGHIQRYESYYDEEGITHVILKTDMKDEYTVLDNREFAYMYIDGKTSTFNIIIKNWRHRLK